MSDMQHRKTVPSVQPYEPWEEMARELIVERMDLEGIGYKELATLLERFGVYESPDQINRKVNRKRFSAAFLLACLRAMDVNVIRIIKGRIA